MSRQCEATRAVNGPSRRSSSSKSRAGAAGSPRSSSAISARTPSPRSSCASSSGSLIAAFETGLSVVGSPAAEPHVPAHLGEAFARTPPRFPRVGRRRVMRTFGTISRARAGLSSSGDRSGRDSGRSCRHEPRRCRRPSARTTGPSAHGGRRPGARVGRRGFPAAPLVRDEVALADDRQALDGEVGKGRRERLAARDQLVAPAQRLAARNVRPLAVVRDEVAERRPVTVGERLAEPPNDLDVVPNGHGWKSIRAPVRAVAQPSSAVRPFRGNRAEGCRGSDLERWPAFLGARCSCDRCRRDAGRSGCTWIRS